MTCSDLRRFAWVPPLLLAAACGGGSSHSPQCAAPTSYAPAAAGPNVVPISVSGAECPASGYLNEPCVSVTVCAPGTSTCQTIGGLLLDTGSTGVRVFSQVLSPSLVAALPPVTQGGDPIAECLGFFDLSSIWGPVVTASVVLGGEPAVTVPIQLIDSSFPGYGTRPGNCASPQPDPADAGYNGILGVAQWIQDCGDCTLPNNSRYFACDGSSCASSPAMPLASQVTNPVAVLPADNNGVIVELPSVPASGAPSVAGQLVLGIATRANNVPGSSVVAFPLDDGGNFRTTTSGWSQPLASFLDTGSNGLFFPTTNAALTRCRTPDDGWFCPATPVTLTATNAPAAGAPSSNVCFQISSLDALPRTAGVSSTIGGPDTSHNPYFDWGLPFHFGRNVYVGIEGASSPLGTGPLVAY